MVEGKRGRREEGKRGRGEGGEGGEGGEEGRRGKKGGGERGEEGKRGRGEEGKEGIAIKIDISWGKNRYFKKYPSLSDPQDAVDADILPRALAVAASVALREHETAPAVPSHFPPAVFVLVSLAALVNGD